MTRNRALIACTVVLTCMGVAACDEDDEDSGSADIDGGAGASGTTGRTGGTGGGGGTSGAGSGGTAGNAGSGGNGGGATGGTSGGGSGGNSGADAGVDSGTDAAVELSDAEIMAVTTAANMGEIAQANAALGKLTDEEAQDFATMMVEMHTAAQTRQSALAEAKDVTPQANALSMALTADSEAIVAQINAASADEVDELYMEAQVTVHEKVLATIEDVLLPSADDADLVDELATSRGEVATHLELARDILEAL